MDRASLVLSVTARTLNHGGVRASPGYLGIGREWVGKLLCPAGVVHVVLTILLARAWFGIT